MFKLFSIIFIIIFVAFSHSKHFVLFKNGYRTNLPPLLITTKETLTQCLTNCFYKFLCYAVSIEKTSENKYECSLYESLDFNTTSWVIKPNTKVFVKLLDSCLAYRIHGFTKSGVYHFEDLLLHGLEKFECFYFVLIPQALSLRQLKTLWCTHV